MGVCVRWLGAGVGCGWLLSAVVAAQVVSPVLRLTEAEALDRFMRLDPRVRALHAGVDVVRAERSARTRWSNPDFVFSREDAGDAHDTFVVWRQELPVTGRLGVLRRANELAVEAARLSGDFEIDQLRAEVRRAFAHLLAAQERETLLAQGLAEFADVVTILRAREDAGEGSAFDRMRAERELAAWESARAAAAVQRVEAQRRLAVAVGGTSPDEPPLAAAGSLAPSGGVPALSDLVTAALERRNDYRALEQAVTRMGAEREAADRLRLPTPTVSGGSKRSGLGDPTRSGYVFSVDLTVPLFNRGLAEAAQADAERIRLEARREALRGEITAAVRAARDTLLLREDQTARYQQAVTEVAEALAEVGRLAYQEGELGILELLDAERQALEARLEALRLTEETRLARIELDRVVAGDSAADTGRVGGQEEQP